MKTVNVIDAQNEIHNWRGWELWKLDYQMDRVMRKGPGRHDTWFRVICIWNLRQDGGKLMVRTFKERFLRFQLSFPDFYHFHHVIWGMKWAKKLKTKNGQNMSSEPFSHDVAQIKREIVSLTAALRFRSPEGERELLNQSSRLNAWFIY